MADFCYDPEGWGPVSSIRYAFTPCFQDGILAAIPPLFLFVAGSAQAFQFSQSARIPGSRTWIYFCKIATVSILLGLNIVLGIIRWKDSVRWQHDVFYWSALLKILATAFAFGLHHLEHVRNPAPVPSGVLLLYWLGTILVDGIKEYGMIDADVRKQLLYFVLFSVVLGGEVLIFALEYLVPKGTKEYYLLQQQEQEDGADVCPADYADIFSRYATETKRLTLD
jgi:ATP-binding cassette, subfamily C (CFTR/MRP), member 1